MKIPTKLIEIQFWGIEIAGKKHGVKKSWNEMFEMEKLKKN